MKKPRRKFSLLHSPIRITFGLVYPFILLAVLYVCVFLYGNSNHLQRVLETVLNDALPGRIAIGEVQLEPSLLSVTTYDAHLYHPDGEELISLREAEASLDPFALLAGGVRITQLRVVEPRVLVSFDHKGEYRMLEALTDMATTDPRQEQSDDDGDPMALHFEDVTVIDAEVLVHMDDFAILVEGAHIDRAAVHVGRSAQITGDVVVPRGRAVFLPELFQLSDPRETLALRRYRQRRYRTPWAAVREELPARVGTDYGALVIDINRSRFERVMVLDDVIRIAAFDLSLDRAELRGEGWIDTDVDDKDLDFLFAASGDLSLHPDSPALTYFSEDLIAPIDDESQVALRDFDVRGSNRAIGGRVPLELVNAEVGGWVLNDAKVFIESLQGEPFVIPPGGLDVALGQGALTGEGWFDPRDGRYALDLWLDDISAREGLTPVLGEAAAPYLTGVLVSEPRRPNEEAGTTFAGVRLTGDLDIKSFPSLAASRALRAEGDLLTATFSSLRWERPEADELPFAQAELSGHVRLGKDGVVHLSGVDGAREMRGRLDRDELTAHGSLDLITERFLAVSLTGSARSLRKLLGVRDLEGRASATLRVSGAFSDPVIQVGGLHISDLFAAGLEIGLLVATGELFNLTRQLTLDEGRVTLSNIEYGGFTASEVTSDYAFDGEWLHVSHAVIKAEVGDLAVEGRVRLMSGDTFRDDPELDLRISSDALDLSTLLPGEPVEGSLTVSGRVQGTPNRPVIEGTFALTEAGLYSEAVDMASGQVRYDPSGVTLENLEIRAGDAAARGAMRLDPNFSIVSGDLTVRDLALEQLQALTELGVDLRGSVDAWLNLTAPDDIERRPGLDDFGPAPGIPDLQGTVLIDDFAVGEADYGSVALSIDTYGDTIQAVGLVARHLGTRIRYPLRGGPVTVSATFDRVPLVDLLPGLSDALDGGEANRGELSLLFDPPTGDIEATFSVGSAWLDARGRRFNSGGPILLTYGNLYDEHTGEVRPTLVLPELRFGSRGRYLVVDGTIVEFSQLDLTVDGDAELSLAALLTDVVADASGVAHVDLTVGGTLDTPAPAGFVTVDDGLLTIRGLGDDILIDQAVVELRPEESGALRLIISREQPFLGSLFDGAVRLDGEVRLQDFEPQSLDVALFATNFTYRLPEELHLTFNRADLTMWGGSLERDQPTFLLSGNIFVEEGLYFKDLGGLGGAVRSALVGLFEREAERFEQPIWETNPLLGLMQFDLGIRASDGVFIRNQMFGADVEAEMQIDLQLRGTLAEPELTGDVKLLEGEIVFQNRTFTVRNCTLLFQGETTEAGVPLPYVDSCVAEASIERSVPRRQRRSSDENQETLAETTETRPEPYIIQVTAEGTLDDVELSFSSVNYALVQADIVSLIFLGVTADEVGSQAAREPSLDLVVRELVRLIEQPLERSLPFDTFAVSPTVSGATTFYLEREFSDRLDLAWETTVFGAEDDGQRAILQYTLSDSIILEVSEQSSADENVEVDGRVRFRFDLD